MRSRQESEEPSWSHPICPSPLQATLMLLAQGKLQFRSKQFMVDTKGYFMDKNKSQKYNLGDEQGKSIRVFVTTIAMIYHCNKTDGVYVQKSVWGCFFPSFFFLLAASLTYCPTVCPDSRWGTIVLAQPILGIVLYLGMSAQCWSTGHLSQLHGGWVGRTLAQIWAWTELRCLGSEVRTQSGLGSTEYGVVLLQL